MTLDQLLEVLQDLREATPEEIDPEVIFLSQPSYPFENSIRAVDQRHGLDGTFPEDEEDNTDGKTQYDIIIMEGRQLRYGKKDHFSHY